MQGIVHLDPDRLSRDYSAFSVVVPEWWIEAAPPAFTATASSDLRPTQEFGDQWIGENRSVVLRVPSVVVPAEFNYVINPNHPKFARLKRSGPGPFKLDSRLVSRG